MHPQPFQLTLWDVGHGLSVWIKTPSGHHHWVDAGGLPEFSPSRHVSERYGVRHIDLLTISHADKDHFDDLDNFLACFGAPRIFHRNTSVPDVEKYGSLAAGYQRALQWLDQSFTAPVPTGQEPWSPRFNGGITIQHFCLPWQEAGSINDASIVTFYLYAGWLFILPGDIGPGAWKKLWIRHHESIRALVSNSRATILVAPHHGRASGYSEDLISSTAPDLIVMSDGYGTEPTDPRFRDRGRGLEHNASTGELKRINMWLRLVGPAREPTLLEKLLAHTRDIKYLTMKSTGRLQFRIGAAGDCSLHIFEE